MTIRAKLYTAIVLTVLGPMATTAVALQGMSQLGDRFDEGASAPRTRRSRVSSSSGSPTSTAGRRPRAMPKAVPGAVRGPAAELRRELELAAEELTDESEARC